MEVERLVGRQVRVLPAQCDQTTDTETAAGVLVHVAGGRLLLRLDDDSYMPVELGWVISITETQRAGRWLFFHGIAVASPGAEAVFMAMAGGIEVGEAPVV